jgi:gluconolactonase
MKKNIVIILISVFFISACKDASKQNKTKEISQEEPISTAFSIEILDDEALEIINPNTPIEVLAKGFTWTEWPVSFSFLPRILIKKSNWKKWLLLHV